MIEEMEFCSLSPSEATARIVVCFQIVIIIVSCSPTNAQENERYYSLYFGVINSFDGAKLLSSV